MDKIELIRLKSNVYGDVQELLINYGLYKDERLTQHIADEIIQKVVEQKENR